MSLDERQNLEDGITLSRQFAKRHLQSTLAMISPTAWRSLQLPLSPSVLADEGSLLHRRMDSPLASGYRCEKPTFCYIGRCDCPKSTA